MFCALKGATEMPCRAHHRHRPVTSVLLPAPDDVPATKDGASQRGGSALSLTPAESKVAISRRIFAAACTVGTASTAPVPSPSRMPRSRTGERPELLEDDRRPRLARTVARDQVPGDLGGKRRAISGRGRGDDPVDDHGHPTRRRTDDEAAQRRDLEAAELRQHDQRLRVRRGTPGQRPVR